MRGRKNHSSKISKQKTEISVKIILQDQVIHFLKYEEIFMDQ